MPDTKKDPTNGVNFDRPMSNEEYIKLGIMQTDMIITELKYIAECLRSLAGKEPREEVDYDSIPVQEPEMVKTH